MGALTLYLILLFIYNALKTFQSRDNYFTT